MKNKLSDLDNHLFAQLADATRQCGAMADLLREVTAFIPAYGALVSELPIADELLDRIDALLAGKVSTTQQDECTEVLRKAINALPRYSFLKDESGNVRRVEDRSGSWIEWDAAHSLLDPVVVDALLAGKVPESAAAWRMMCGDWRDELVALHGPDGHIVSGLTVAQARAIIDAHGGADPTVTSTAASKPQGGEA